MKDFKYYIALFAVCLITSTVYAQDRTGKFEHQIIAGLNIGASAPVGLPSEIRSIDSYWPQFTPRLGYNVRYGLNEKWLIGSGIVLDYKGMGTKATVKYIYTRVRLSDSESSGDMEGYFVGKNKTEVKAAYVTIPLTLNYAISERWMMRTGGYASYAFSKEFNGEVSDGYLRKETMNGEKIEIDKADFEFNNDMRKFDIGLLLGTEMKVNEKFGISGDLTWGLTPIFPSSFTGMKFNMYNIYFALGLTYKL